MFIHHHPCLIKDLYFNIAAGLEAGKHQIKAYADKDGEHLLGQDEISVEDVFKDVSRLANNK